MSDATGVLRDIAFLSALLDTLIPPGSGSRLMPGAGGIGIEAAVAEAIAADAQSGLAVTAALEAFRERTPGFASLAPPERVPFIEAFDPSALRAALRHVYLAYYQHPTVLAALGEPPRPPFPEGFELEPTAPELLAALHSRRI